MITRRRALAAGGGLAALAAARTGAGDGCARHEGH